MAKKKKIYISFFYGSNQELTRAFSRITGGDYVRYIMTAETLICRFKSNMDLDDIIEILREYVPDVPFFVFPIENKGWRYNLPMDVENNLLTDNPIIHVPQNNIIQESFMSMIDDIKKNSMVGNKSIELLDKAVLLLQDKLKQSINNENYELAGQIRDKIKEIENQKDKMLKDTDEY